MYFKPEFPQDFTLCAYLYYSETELNNNYTICQYKMPQSKKKWCKQCTMRDSPPTGKRRKYVQQETSDVEDSGLSRDATVKGGSPSADPVSGQQQILQQLQKVNQ